MTSKVRICAACAVATMGALAADPVRVEWNFNDARRPLASTGMAGMDLVKRGGGQPAFVDGVIGKAVEFAGEKFSLLAPLELNAALTDGKKSFTVDCFVKADGIDYYRFIGNRTVATWYGPKGWALGCLRTGNLVAVIGDGEKRTYTVFNHLQSSWEPGAWNHLALVRDAEKNEIRFYLNGTAAGWQVCRNANSDLDAKTPLDVSTTAQIRIGDDPMTGGCLVGAIDEVRITEGVMSTEEIAARAKLAASAGKGSPKFAAAKTPVAVADADLVRPTALTLLPRPRTYEASADVTKISSCWRAEGLDERAREALVERLDRSCGMTTNGTAGVVFRFEDAKMEHAEGFEVRGGAVADGAYEVRVRAEGHARYYAMDVVGQIFRKTSLEQGGVLSAPKSFALTDWPSMPRRMSLSPIGYELKCTDRVFDVAGRDMAFMRLNGMHFQIQHAPEARIKAMCDGLRHYGVGVIPWWAYMGRNARPITPLSSEEMAELKAYFDKGGRAGVAGYTIAFDDLNGPFVDILKRADVKAAYGTAGALHNALVKKAVEFSKPYGPKLWQAIPFSYGVDGNGSARSDYFKDFCKDFDAMDVVTLHTVFTEEGVGELHESGVQKFGYYVNGTWPTPLFFKWYMGPECVPWTWNMFYIDRNGVGPVPYLDRLEEVKHVHERGTVLFGASSAHRSRYIAGWFSWNPAAWDDELAARALTQRFFGSGVHEPLSWYAKLVAPMVGAFMAYKTSWTNESKAPETKRLAPMSKSEIMGYFRNLEKAEKAVALVEAAIRAQQTAFDRPELSPREAKGNQEKLLADMRGSLKEIRVKLEKLAEKHGVARPRRTGLTDAR